MKNLRLIIIIVSSFLSCKKDKTKDKSVQEDTTTTELKSGLPSDYRNINGYLYACYKKTTGYPYNNVYYFAAFGDPTRNLIINFNHYNDVLMPPPSGTINTAQGNISVGTVSFANQYSLYQQYSGYNVLTYGMSISDYNSSMPNPSWKIGGNGSFKAFDVNITRGFPNVYVTYPSTTPTLNWSQGFQFNNVSASNYDSLTIIIGYYSSYSLYAKKTFVAGEPLSFSGNDLQMFSTSVGDQLPTVYYAYNYSNITLSGKKYVFELARKIENGYVMINPN